MANQTQTNLRNTVYGASRPIGGALPADMPPPVGSVGKTDKAIAKNTAAKLTTALKGTNDPQLKAIFAGSLSSFHSYLSQDTKAAKKGQGPKVNSKAVREAKPVKSSRKK